MFMIADYPKKEKKPLKVKGCKYDPEKYPKYDNYDAIECSRSVDIPVDYNGVIGVPISILYHFYGGYINVEYDDGFLSGKQFEIVWIASGHSKTTMPNDIAKELNADFEMKSKANTGNGYAILNGIQLYHRILIKRVF